MEIRVNPTRMELGKLKKRLTTARRGHKLLKDKRDELMKQFLALAKENMELRERAESALFSLNEHFLKASAATNPNILQEALIYPKVKAGVTVSERNIMSVRAPVFAFDEAKLGSDIYAYGFAFTSGELDEALSFLRRCLPTLLRLAETEKAVQLLAAEIERTRRRVNALEYIMIPSLEATIKRIVMKLAENERGNNTRLMKVKDMMVENARLQKEKM